MGETVSYYGKLKLIAKGETEAISFAKEKLSSLAPIPSYCNDILGWLLEDDKYFYTNTNNLYEIISKVQQTAGDAYIMTPTDQPDEFDFFTQFYNSGMDFYSAIEEAEKNLKL